MGHPKGAYTCDVANIGRVAKPRIASGGRLVADLMIDVAAANKADARIVERLRAGRPIELSTGLFTSNEPSAGYDHRGRRYEGIAREHRPDHVAVLLDGRGACSVEDGCGVLLNGYRSRLVQSVARVLMNARKVKPLKTPEDYEMENPTMPTPEDEGPAPATWSSLLDELAASAPPRGGLLPLLHKPSLPERLADSHALQGVGRPAAFSRSV